MVQVVQPLPGGSQSTSQKKNFRWSWSKIKEDLEQSSTAAQLAKVQPTNFYEKAIEWTHRADKIINLVLGYLLAIASVLGFMDVLSNGQVLGQVPYLFYVWLGIMGLGIDFQILLVIGRIPDLLRMPVAGWQKFLIFLFNVVFLVFLCVMSVMTSAIFTQHRDMPLVTVLNPLTQHLVTRDSTIDDAMNVLGINSILFVYGRAALATLLLVLMAVDRTMERWRMQIIATREYTAQIATSVQAHQETAQPAALQPSELDKVLQTVVTMNQQNLQLMREMNRQTVEQVSQISMQVAEETVNRIAATLAFPVQAANVKQLVQDLQHEENTAQTGELEAMDLSGISFLGQQSSLAFEKGYSGKIEALLLQEPDLSDRDIAARVGCSVRTANRWKNRVQQPEH
ncbi:MAG TPA: helix-turn-helix domain-containing protein [Ktedonobacteraceae bacterium]|jgi:hypothetical protein|nr:helix-turn-helix domain-containing protein [Ktedonobacteraceae bacterium]